MMTLEERNKEIVRQYEEEAIGGRNLDLMDELMADTYIAYPEGQGRDELKQRLAEAFQQYPTGTIQIEEMIAEGHTVATRIHYAFEGRPPWRGLTLYHLAEGKIVKTWHYHEPLEAQ